MAQSRAKYPDGQLGAAAPSTIIITRASWGITGAVHGGVILDATMWNVDSAIGSFIIIPQASNIFRVAPVSKSARALPIAICGTFKRAVFAPRIVM